MLEQGIQANFPEPRLKATGCHFFALLKYLEIEQGFFVRDNDHIIEIFNKALENGYMDNVCNVLNAPELLNMILQKPFYGIYHRDLKERSDARNLYIVRLVRKDGTHFMCEYKGFTFDPMPINRPAAATWNLDSYRYLI